MKRDAGDWVPVIQRVFPGAIVVQWGKRVYLAPPADPQVREVEVKELPKPRRVEVGDGPRLF